MPRRLNAGYGIEAGVLAAALLTARPFTASRRKGGGGGGGGGAQADQAGWPAGWLAGWQTGRRAGGL